MQIEQDTDRMYERHTQQAIAQMPEVSWAFDSTAIGQLPKDGLNAIANTSQGGTPTRDGLRTGFTKRSPQDHTYLAQGCLQCRQPVVAIAQELTTVPAVRSQTTSPSCR